MLSVLYEKYLHPKITDNLLAEAAYLFSSHYAKWNGRASTAVGPFAKAADQISHPLGAHVKVSKTSLRKHYIPDDASCTYIRVKVDDFYAGHVFACRWDHNDAPVCWITQLVIHREYRERACDGTFE
ncbi:hypothetical protein MMC14_005074 [Varicellaria rhodocarpa]|nr:hypothetical protein [Varicellaria rhodocarpa]